MKQQRLKHREVADYRKKLLAKQKGLCKLCGLPVKPEDATLDHCHDSGHIRAVLHRNCNQVEGRIKSWAKRAYSEPLHFLQQLVDFWQEDYSHYAIHPNHRTAEEREIRKLKKQMRRLKSDAAKARYKARIKELEQSK